MKGIFTLTTTTPRADAPCENSSSSSVVRNFHLVYHLIFNWASASKKHKQIVIKGVSLTLMQKNFRRRRSLDVWIYFSHDAWNCFFPTITARTPRYQMCCCSFLFDFYSVQYPTTVSSSSVIMFCLFFSKFQIVFKNLLSLKVEVKKLENFGNNFESNDEFVFSYFHYSHAKTSFRPSQSYAVLRYSKALRFKLL